MISNVPKHIAIILDGNRRFAKKLMIKPWKGHEWGAKKVQKLLEWCNEIGVEEVTLYAFSIENFNRPKEEFDYLMSLFKKEFEDLINNKAEELKEKGLKIRFIGRIEKFPEDVRKSMYALMDLTKDNKTRIVNFAMAYGGRQEIIDAVRKLSEKVKTGSLDLNNINEETFAENLYLNSDPELVIRTGGEKRTSNFLSWQSTYSEWIFIEKPWPEFEKEDLLKAINDYSKRDRRFGK